MLPSLQNQQRLLRYRFDSSRQLERHLHTVEARTLLFFPTASELRSGDPAILEIAFAANEPQCLLRGRVEAVEQGLFRGAWLEFATLDTLAAAAGCADIRARRLPANLFVRAERQRAMPVVCRLEDVSIKGARVCGLGTGVSPGEELKFSMMGKFGAWRGRVRWVQRGMAGVQFEAPQPQLLEAALEPRPAIVEHRHLPDCSCSGGRRREPSLPRAFVAGSRAARFLGRVELG